MRLGYVIAAMLICLLFGGVGGYLLGGHPQPVAPFTPEPAAGADVTWIREPEPVEAPRREAVEEPRQETVRADRPTRDELDIPETRGQGSISGVVVDGTETPLPGVWVNLRWFGTSPITERWTNLKVPANTEAEFESQLEDNIRITRREAYWRWDVERRVETDEQGRFRFDQVLEGRYGVYGAHPGWEFDSATVDSASNRSVRLVGQSIAKIPVRVLMPDGTLAEECQISATLTWASAPGPHAHGTWHRDRNPYLRLGPGNWSVRFTSGEYLVAHAEMLVERLVPHEPIEIQLDQKRRVTGRIVYTGARPMGGLRVQLGRIDASGNPAQIAGVQRVWYEGHLDKKNETFQIMEVSAGMYSVSLLDQSGHVLATGRVTVASRATETSITVSAPADPHLLMSVRDPAGALSPVDLWQLRVTAGGNHVGCKSCWQADDGTLQVWFNEPPAEETALIIVAEVRNTGRASAQITWRPGASVNLQLRAEAALHLTIRNIPEALQSRLDVHFADELGQAIYANANGRHSKDNSEVAAWSGLAAGPIWLAVRLSGDRFVPLLSQEFHLAAGPNRETIVLPELYSITLVGTALTADTDYALYYETEPDKALRHGSVFLKAGETLVLDCLLPGSYYLSKGWAQEKTHAFVVPTDRAVHLDR